MKNTTEHINITELKGRIEKFASERNWNQFHNPKNLAMALSVEAGELVEIFQWLTSSEAENIAKDGEKKEAVADELSDIFVYLLRLSDKLGINLAESVESKLKKNAVKYPVDKAYGNSKKYTDL